MWSLEYSKDADLDFELTFDHLFASYLDLGDSAEEALERGANRIRELRLEINRLVETPYIGTLRPDIYPGIRFLRRDKAVVWFLPIEERKRIIVATIFFGGQYYIRRMLARMLQR